jgi:CheY-like chemotaxis protein
MHSAKPISPPTWNHPAATTAPEAMQAPLSLTSFVGRKRTDRETLGLLIAASDYAIAAVQRMIESTAQDPTALARICKQYVDLVFGLEVNYIFPNLPSPDRELLVALMKARNALGVQLNAPAPPADATSAADPIVPRVQLQAQFLDLSRQVLTSHIPAQLDPLQLQILDDEFLGIVLDKENSTTWFFRRTQAPSDHRTPEGTPPSPTGFTSQSETAPARSRKPDLPTELPPGSSPSQRHVLFLTPNLAAIDTVLHWLTQAGYAATAGNAGLDGYLLVRRRSPDVVLLDCVGHQLSPAAEPDPDALQFMGFVRQFPGPSTPILIAFSSRENKRRLLDAGAAACLVGPLDARRLLAALQVALESTTPAPSLTAAA